MPRTSPTSRHFRPPVARAATTVLATTAALLAAAAGLAPAPASAQAAPDRTTVAGFTDAFLSAVRSWDVDAWAALVTEDVVMMAPNGRIVEGRDAFHDLWSRSFEGQTGVNPLQITVRGVEAGPELAVVRADYGPEGSDPVGQYVWTLVRDDPSGPWSLRWWIFNRMSADG